MMRRPRAPLFLSRRFYRRRRLRDAARLLPVFGMFFLFLPMLWSEPIGHAGAMARDTARDAVYFFWVWIALVIFAMIFSAGLASEESDEADKGDDD